MTGLLLALLCGAADPAADIRALLLSRGVAVEAAAAEAAAARAAAEAVVRLADPGARFFDAAEAAAFAAAEGASTTNPPALRELGEGILLLTAPAIGEAAAALADEALSTASASGLILDCRGAGGTNLAAVDALAARFVEPDTFLYAVQDAAGEDLELHAAPEAPRARIPVLMLADGKTSGAAEVLAAVLAGSRGAMLVGTPTKGDATRRELVPLASGGYAYMASGRLVRPDGTSWEKTGVEPHVRVPPGAVPAAAARTNLLSRAGKPFDETARRHLALFARVHADPGLARAVDLLLGLKALAILPENDHGPVAAADRR